MPVSLNSTLAAARSALMSNQAAMQVVSDNIANAGTVGYTRKRAEIATGPSQVLPEGVFGTGVVVRDVSQLRDRFLDAAYRDASSSRQQQQVRYDYLEQIEGAFGEPESGLSTTLDAFWNSWSDLAGDPLNQSARGVIRERGLQLVAQVKRLWNSLGDVRVSATRRLDAELEQINQLTARIARLNEDIVATESGGTTAGNLRDERDLAIDQLADIAAIQVIERGNGSVAVAFDGLTLVDGSGSQQLEPSRLVGSTVRVFTASGAELVPSSGSLSGYLALLNHDLPDFRAGLNDLVTNIATAVNTLHAGGINPNGDQVDFFTTSGVAGQEASSFDLAASTVVGGVTIPGVKDDARAIAAGAGRLAADGVTWEYLPGTNDVASDIAALRGAATITTFYHELVTEVGNRTSVASDTARAQAALAGHAANRRDSFMGVSTDEELVDLIRLQKAYTAAARVVSMADEMMQTLLDMKR